MANTVSKLDSQWLGSIPKHWSLVRLGSLFSLRNEKVSDRDYAPLSVSRGGIVPQMVGVAKSDASDDRKLVLAGDFVINSRSDRKGSCGVSELDGSVSLINIVLEPKDKNLLYGPYLNFLLKNHGFSEEFYRWGHGIVADLWTTRWQEMKSIYLPLPSLEEQKKIAFFLNNKTTDIDRLIDTEEAQIESLKQYLACVIDETVCGTLHPNEKRKNCGLSWITSIPSTWQSMPLKTLFGNAKGLLITKADLIENGVKVISYGQIHAKYNNPASIDDRLFRFVSPSYLQTDPECLTDIGDFIFADTSEDVAGSGDFVCVDKNGPIFAGYHTITLKAKRPEYSPYFAYLFMSNRWKTQIQSKVSGVKLFSISKSILMGTTIILPPLNEQIGICKKLDTINTKIRKIITIKLEKIESLKRLKASLVYEYVTGKKEVA